MEPTEQTFAARSVGPLPQPNDEPSVLQMLVGLRSYYTERDRRHAMCSHACTNVNVFPLRGVHVDPDSGIIRLPAVVPRA